MMYKIKNIAKDTRRFMDKYTGKIILVQPGESALTKKLPSKNSVFEITMVEKKTYIEKKDKKDKLNTQEENNGSNTNR